MNKEIQQHLSKLVKINSMNSSNHSELQEEYMKVFYNCQQLDDSQKIAALQDFANAVLKDSLSSVLAGILLNKVCKELYNFEITTAKKLALYLLEKIRNRIVTFEEHDTKLRIFLSTVFSNEKNWSLAAEMLSGTVNDVSQKLFTVEERIVRLLDVAQLYLNDNKPVIAQSYTKRAIHQMDENTSASLKNRGKACTALALDYQFKFLDAAQKYNELSYVTSLPVSDQNEAIEKALNCAILSPAGPKRGRMLAVLYKDERCQNLSTFSILENMFLERIIRQQEVELFSKQLMPHHLKDVSVLANAITEHNILSTSKLFTNINFNKLGLLLGVSSSIAEEKSRKMICEGRMEGSIDQISNILYFNHLEVLPSWHSQVEKLCSEVNQVVDLIKEVHRDWVELQLTKYHAEMN